MNTKNYNKELMKEFVQRGRPVGGLDITYVATYADEPRRWTTTHFTVFKDNSDGLLYQVDYEIANTEKQENSYFECGEFAVAVRVTQVEKTITVYEVMK